MDSKTVLVVDDDIAILEVIKVVLEENNYTVVTREDGLGLDKDIALVKPDIILLDLWIPGAGGKEILPILKKNKTHANIPVIIMSASDELEKIAKELKADGFLAKPFNLSHLEKTLTSFLRN